MSSHTPTLTYFDIRGLAELPRLCFAAAGVAFNDDRIPFERKADGSVGGPWPELKAKMPFKQVPVLKVGEHIISQSSAIIRYIARTHKLDGHNSIDQALVDAGFEAMLDIRKTFFTNKSDAAKTATFFETGLAESLQLIAANARSTDEHVWYNGHNITYTDVAIYYFLWVLATENDAAVKKAIASAPKVQKIYDAVEKHENVAKYLAARKQTPM